MSQNDSNIDRVDAANLTEVLKLLQKGEQTADTMEKKLDMVEKELDRLLQQMEGIQPDQVTEKTNKQRGDVTN